LTQNLFFLKLKQTHS